MPTAQATQPSPSSPQLEDDDLTVEAALFSAGRPMDLVELAEQTELTQNEITSCLLRLRETYKARDTSLDVVKSGEKWALALRAEYADKTRHIVPPEVPRHVLRTLALIAYHQPILQSDLKDLVGSKVYEHVGHLVEAGMITKRPDGLTYRLSTSKDFPEYFGIPANEAERIRRFLAEKVGIVPEEGGDPLEEYRLDDQDPEDETTDDAAPGEDQDEAEDEAEDESEAEQAEAERAEDEQAEVAEDAATGGTADQGPAPETDATPPDGADEPPTGPVAEDEQAPQPPAG